MYSPWSIQKWGRRGHEKAPKAHWMHLITFYNYWLLSWKKLWIFPPFFLFCFYRNSAVFTLHIPRDTSYYNTYSIMIIESAGFFFSLSPFFSCASRRTFFEICCIASLFLWKMSSFDLLFCNLSHLYLWTESSLWVCGGNAIFFSNFFVKWGQFPS